MRKTITATQVAYLLSKITTHIEDGCDDTGRWLVALKFTHRVHVTMDNMAIYVYDYEPDIKSMDEFFEQLRNEFAPRSVFMPDARCYYK